MKSEKVRIRPKLISGVCVICGDLFYTDRAATKCCSVSCGHVYAALRRGGKLAKKKSLALIEKGNAKRLALEKCRETAPVTVEVRGNRVIETRGRACIGWKSCGHFSNKG